MLANKNTLNLYKKYMLYKITLKLNKYIDKIYKYLTNFTKENIIQCSKKVKMEHHGINIEEYLDGALEVSHKYTRKAFKD